MEWRFYPWVFEVQARILCSIPPYFAGILARAYGNLLGGQMSSDNLNFVEKINLISTT